MTRAPGTWTDSSQPGRSSGEWDRLRGWKARKPDPPPEPGAANAKKPIAVARPKVKVLGAAPPVEVEELAAPSGGGNSNGRRCPCEEACDAARAVGSAACCGRSDSDSLDAPCVAAGPRSSEKRRRRRGPRAESADQASVRALRGRARECGRDLDRVDWRRDDEWWQLRQRRLRDLRAARGPRSRRRSRRPTAVSAIRGASASAGRKRRPLHGYPRCRVEGGCDRRGKPGREGGTRGRRRYPRNSQHPLGDGLGHGDARDRERRWHAAPVVDGRTRWCLAVRRGRFCGWSAAVPPPPGGGLSGVGGASTVGAQSQPGPVPVPVETRTLAGERRDLGGRPAPGERPCPHPRRVTRSAWSGRRRRIRLCDGAVVARAQDSDRHVHVRGPDCGTPDP